MNRNNVNEWISFWEPLINVIFELRSPQNAPYSLNIAIIALMYQGRQYPRLGLNAVLVQ